MTTFTGGAHSSKGKPLSTRVLSLLLALILVCGMLPIPEASAAEGGRTDIPNSIYVDQFQRIAKFTSPMLGGGDNLLHYIRGNYQGSTKTFFCGVHGKDLGKGTWQAYEFDNGLKYIPADSDMVSPYMIFGDYYYNMPNENLVSNAWVQACIWIMRTPSGMETYLPLLSATSADVHAGNYDDILRPIAKEAVAAAKAADSSYNQTAEWMTGNIRMVVADWLDRKIPHRDWIMFTRDGLSSKWQPMLIGIPAADPPGDAPGPDKVWLKVKKVDGSNKPLSGAVFGIYGTSGCEGEPLATITTGADGFAYWSEELQDNKTSDTVYVKETTAPAGYELDSTIRSAEMTVANNNVKEKAFFVGGKAIVNNPTGDPPDNPDNPGTPSPPSEGTIRKVDQYGKGVAGAVFRIYGTGEDGQTVSVERESQANGVINLQWTDPDGPNFIQPGHYTVEEIKAPAGYRATHETRHLELYGNGTSSGDLIFTNEKFRTIKLLKQSEDEEPLSGAVFRVERDGKFVGNYTTGPDGTFVVEGENGQGVLPGFYTLTEITPPPGKMLPANPVHTIFLFDEGDTIDQYEIVAVNYDKPDIEIFKCEKGTENGVAGAVFEVMIDGTLLPGTFKSGPDGKIAITPDTYGEFLTPGKGSWTIQVREISAPAGYLLGDGQWQTVELTEGVKKASFVFENYWMPVIRILKRAAGTTDPLEGAVFKVSIDGTPIGTYETNKNGEIVIDYEEYGEFLKEQDAEGWTILAEEITAPDGYLIDDPNWQEITLHKGIRRLSASSGSSSYC